MIRSVLVGIAALVGAAGCNDKGHFDYKRAAQEELTKEFSCPKERVVVTPRPDLKAYTLQWGAHPAPPADVAADPGRLAVFNQKEKKLEDDYNRQSVIEAKGCDKHVFYICSIASDSNGGQVVACTKATHPPS